MVPGGRGLVALGKDGRVLWVQCYALGRAPDPHFPAGGCGQYKNTPPPNLPPTRSHVPQQPPGGSPVVQAERGDGAAESVRGPAVHARLGAASEPSVALLQRR